MYIKTTRRNTPRHRLTHTPTYLHNLNTKQLVRGSCGYIHKYIFKNIYIDLVVFRGIEAGLGDELFDGLVKCTV